MNHIFHAQLNTPRTIRVLCGAFLMAAFAAPVVASSPDEKGEPKRQESEASGAETSVANSIRVVYDPESGEIISVPVRETEVLSGPLAKALTRSTEGMHIFELSNGGTGVHLDGRFQHALMVRVKSDGSIETVCTSHSHAAEKFLKSTSAGTDVEPRDQ
ncbi:MAG: hypothetical protein OEV48_11265 [Acidobacteriota bacterium]|nr:hypothetical protein [Acidobacteriota bacterium]